MSSTQPASPLAVLDRTRIEQYKKLRPGFLERLVNAYLTESADYMGKLRAGAGGTDLDDTRMTAHALKSASVNLGAMRLGEICQRIETAAHQKDVDELGQLVHAIGIEYFEADQALRGVLREVRTAPAASA